MITIDSETGNIVEEIKIHDYNEVNVAMTNLLQIAVGFVEFAMRYNDFKNAKQKRSRSSKANTNKNLLKT